MGIPACRGKSTKDENRFEPPFSASFVEKGFLLLLFWIGYTNPLQEVNPDAQ